MNTELLLGAHKYATVFGVAAVANGKQNAISVIRCDCAKREAAALQMHSGAKFNLKDCLAFCKIYKIAVGTRVQL